MIGGGGDIHISCAQGQDGSTVVRMERGEGGVQPAGLGRRGIRVPGKAHLSPL